MKIGPSFSLVVACAIEPGKASEGYLGPIVSNDNFRKANFLMISFGHEESLHFEKGVIDFLLLGLQWNGEPGRNHQVQGGCNFYALVFLGSIAR